MFYEIIWVRIHFIIYIFFDLPSGCVTGVMCCNLFKQEEIIKVIKYLIRIPIINMNIIIKVNKLLIKIID